MLRRLGYLVAIVCLLAVVFLRFYELGNTPPGLNIDEASYGYDAYSIYRTGKDQWGKHLPLTLRSFGDDKPAGLSYTIIPFIHFLGLNTTAVRLPSAIFGLATLWVLFITLRLLSTPRLLSLLLVIIYALSPWTFGLSRLFYEPNVGLFFASIGIYLSLRVLIKQDRPTWQIALFFALSGYWYAAYRLVGGILLTLTLLLRYRLTKANLPRLILPYLVFLLISLPLVFSMLNQSSLTRLGQEFYLRNFGYSLVIDENRAMCYTVHGQNPIMAKACYLIWNKPAMRLRGMAETLAEVMSPEYLFLTSSQKDILPKGYGAYLFPLFPLFIIGIASLWQKAVKTKNRAAIYLLLGWLLSQLPGILIESPLIHRNVIGLYFAFLLIAAGWLYLYKLLVPLPRLRLFIHVGYLTVILLFLTQYLSYYFHVYTKLNPTLWNEDSATVFSYLNEHEHEYDQILVDSYENAPLFYAFYSAEDPAKFQERVVRQTPNQLGWVHAAAYGKVSSDSTPLSKLICDQTIDNALVVTTPNPEYSEYAVLTSFSYTGVHPLHKVYDLAKLRQAVECSK